jgi:hypothetical protein
MTPQASGKTVDNGFDEMRDTAEIMRFSASTGGQSFYESPVGLFAQVRLLVVKYWRMMNWRRRTHLR